MRSIRRIWFKQLMAQAIKDGKKTSTTRDHPLKLEQYQAMGGSRYKAKPFAKIEITEKIPLTWEAVMNMHHKEEGFETSLAMLIYLQANDLIKNFSSDMVFFHRFKVVNLVE